MTYFYLFVAIIFEVAATSALKQADGFTKLWPSLICLAGYAAAFYFLSILVKTMPVGIVYAIWSGAGIVLIAAIGWFWFKQPLDTPAIIGLSLIIAGVLIVNLFSGTVGH
ncbi:MULTISPECIES: DMT family transporter [unclassified Phyllobacterium]|jgi:small multidrug resistance pump|uniref:DMT family transporter n=1 Tax=unclassified Phyllobacterium TaxID=2638441 RepID=UPI001ACB92FD|nr:multidrug efflux SMR transporter [Phyllobacterium sp.]MBQ9351526.1 multidrug efflux SMR transporter [Phyllobacterium sp.]